MRFPGFWQAVALFAVWAVVNVVILLADRKTPHPGLRALASAAATWVVLLIARKRTGRGIRQMLAWVPLAPNVAPAVAGITLCLFIVGVLGFLWIERAFPGSLPRLDYGFSKSPAFALLLIVIVAPLSEEILMRGILLPGFAARYGSTRAILLSALFFACAHGSLARLPHTFLLGAVLGWLYVQTRSLWVSIGAHMFNNLIAGSVLALALAKSRGSELPAPAVPPFQRAELVLAGMCLGGCLVLMSAVPRNNAVPPPGATAE